MTRVLAIAGDEWRLWLRSKLALLALGAMVLIIAVTSVLTATRMADERHARQHQQHVAEETFLSQPDRHPHRMVHYGHYVFRTPPPLAIIDPGVDVVTGQSIFLEGHRQNTPMFADARASANVGSLHGLTPAFVYQVLVPLLLIALGHGVFVREREAKTLAPLLAQGISGTTLYLGKTLALLTLSAALLLPLAMLALVATALGDTMGMSMVLLLAYAGYLAVWATLISVVSAACRTRGLALGIAVFVWMAWALLLPRIAVNAASVAAPVPGKLETDFQMLADLRQLGDGHNAADPAFAQLRANLLAEYDVEAVEDLPINFRGVVAQTSEAELTAVMNDYAERRMAAEHAQSAYVTQFGWASPMLAVAAASRALAGTDLATHHRFLREAEAVRFDFVQGLNQSHIDALSYAVDINRNQNTDAFNRARVSADNWSVLNDFQFAPTQADMRAAHAALPLSILTLWLAGLGIAGYVVAGRLRP